MAEIGADGGRRGLDCIDREGLFSVRYVCTYRAIGGSQNNSRRVLMRRASVDGCAWPRSRAVADAVVSESSPCFSAEHGGPELLGLPVRTG